MMATVQLSIIIVSFNARADLERCLESLHATPPAAPHEIIVVDNGSTDGSAEAARRWPDVRVIETGANLGFAPRQQRRHPRDHAAPTSCCSNSDTIVPAGAIDRLLAELDRDSPTSPSSVRGWSTATAAPSCRSAG